MANTPVTTLRLPVDLKERIEAVATKEGRSTSNMMVRLIEEALAFRDRKDSRKNK